MSGVLWNKFLVTRRDGTSPSWPWFVMGARDPMGPPALRAYAAEARRLGYPEDFAADVERLAEEWEQYRKEAGTGDPEARPHRPDDPEVVKRILAAGGTVNHRGYDT